MTDSAARIVNPATEPPAIWLPDPAEARDATIARFARFAGERFEVELDSYAALWRWSVEQLEPFWTAVWEFFEVQADGSADLVLADDAMPGARWFPGARLNYAEHAFAP